MLSQREIGGSYLASPHKARDLLNSTGRELPIDIEMAVAEFNGIYLELGRQIAKDLRAVGFNPALRAWNPSHYTKALIKEPKEYQRVWERCRHLYGQWIPAGVLAQPRASQHYGAP